MWTDVCAGQARKFHLKLNNRPVGARARAEVAADLHYRSESVNTRPSVLCDKIIRIPARRLRAAAVACGVKYESEFMF